MNEEMIFSECPMCRMRFGISFDANTTYQDQVRERAEMQLAAAAASHFKRQHFFEKKNVVEGRYVRGADDKPYWETADGHREPYLHQDGHYSEICASPKWCRCSQ